MADITRNTWIEKSSELTVKAAEDLIRLFAERSSKDYQPSYTNSYIGLRLDGKPCNFFVIIPQKKAIKLSVKVEKSPDNAYYLKQVATKKIDYTNGWYNVSIEPGADCTDVMIVLLQAEAEFKGVSANLADKEDACEDTNSQATKEVLLTFENTSFKRVKMMPMETGTAEGMIDDAHDMNCSPSETGDWLPYLLGREEIDEMFDEANMRNENVPLNFVFADAYREVELTAFDEETGESLYSNCEYEIDPLTNVMNLEDAEEFFEDEPEELEEYKQFLNAKMTDTDSIVGQSIKKVWGELIENGRRGSDLIPYMMREALAAIAGEAALLHGETEMTASSVTFRIQIPENEEFDVNKLRFLNVDAGGYDSALLNNMLANDACLMNAIIYDGKMYFAQDYDINMGDCEGEELFEIVTDYIEPMDGELYEYR